MSNQQQTPVTAYPVDQSNLAVPPPPVGYPTKDDDSVQQTVPVKTTTRVVLDCAVAVLWIVASD
ncbi:uncharacterized protein HKW66_Vig0207170 [Vigna angularis]|uniref:Uncharacterized protein n=1 Tax=Phaseolus angularis TaxID=3914 RepID=A0A8T0JIK0_PHAAN|nr:uncharacterized protein HKW66_Vig0207170 [Vigna angularis]